MARSGNSLQKEQQREIVSNLSGATADAVRAYQAVQNGLNQYLAAQNYFEALASQKRATLKVESDRMLDAQRRLVQSEIQFFRARAEYAVALKNYQYEKGALLVYKDLRIAGTNVPSETFPTDGAAVEGGGTEGIPAAPPVPETPAEEPGAAVEVTPATSVSAGRQVSEANAGLANGTVESSGDQLGAMTPFPDAETADAGRSRLN